MVQAAHATVTKFQIFEQCLAKEIVEILQPDYSEKIAEIEKYEFASVNINGHGPEQVKILFTTPQYAIVQEILLEMSSDLPMRFRTYKIQLGAEWDAKFVEFVEEDSDEHDTLVHDWQSGVELYGDG